MDKYKQMIELIDKVETDIKENYVKQNNADGERFRKHMQELKALAEEIRVAISDRNME